MHYFGAVRKADGKWHKYIGVSVHPEGFAHRCAAAYHSFMGRAAQRYFRGTGYGHSTACAVAKDTVETHIRALSAFPLLKSPLERNESKFFVRICKGWWCDYFQSPAPGLKDKYSFGESHQVYAASMVRYSEAVRPDYVVGMTGLDSVAPWARSSGAVDSKTSQPSRARTVCIVEKT